MRMRVPIALLVAVALGSCASGSGGSPELRYAVPMSPELTYIVADTVTIDLSALGQEMEIGARSVATYAVRVSQSAGGVRVTATIEDLAAEVVVPMAEPIAMEESALSGEFVFELDSRGRVTSMSSPQVNEVGGQVFAAPVVAHTLFPRLPGRSVSTGDSWVDTVTYAETGDAGETRYVSALTYTVLGQSRSGGRSLMEIGFAGTAEVTQDLSIEGASISQRSEVEAEGRVLWDVEAGVLYESETTLAGPGSVTVALLPGAALPTRVTWRTHVRLQER